MGHCNFFRIPQLLWRVRIWMALPAWAWMAAVSGSLWAEAANPERPNVLMIICDDLNTDVGCFGEAQAVTPNIDRLAQGGTRFFNAFAQFSSCMPSRYSFLSGWSPLRTGSHDFSMYGRDGALAQARYLPEHFRAHGYVAARLDKVFHIGRDVPTVWDITEEPMRRTDDGELATVWTGIEIPTLGLTDRRVAFFDYEGVVGGERGVTEVMDNALPDDALYDGQTAARAAELLEQFAGDERPFFLAVGFRRPHLPWIAQERFFEPFPPSAMETTAQPGFEDALPEGVRQEMRAHYFAATHSVDHHIGTVLDVLEATGQADETIVLLFGDHGYALGERGIHYGKGVLWDRALQTPLIIRVPGMDTPSRVDTPVGLIDLYPTLVELAGLPLPPVPLDGRSLRGLLRGKADSHPGRVYSYFQRGVDREAFADSPHPEDALLRSVRTAAWRYVTGPRPEDEELIDVRNDPFAWNNLADNPTYRDVVERMRALLRIER